VPAYRNGCWACGLIAPRIGNQAHRQTKASGGRPRSENPTGQALRQRKCDAKSKSEKDAKRQAEQDRVSANRWVSRMIDAHTTETYCRKCFDVWGWPEEFEAIRAAVEGIADILAGRAWDAVRDRHCAARAAGV
jgi:hypothetical protein